MADRSLSLHDAPPIPGLTFRAYRGPEYFPGMVAVYNACRPVDGYDWPMTVEDLARRFGHLDHFDPHQDMVFAEMNGETIGYGRGAWYREPDGATLQQLYGHGAPAWRRRQVESPNAGRCPQLDNGRQHKTHTSENAGWLAVHLTPAKVLLMAKYAALGFMSSSKGVGSAL